MSTAPAAAAGSRKSSTKSARSRAREFALQALYQFIVGGNPAEDVDLFTRECLAIDVGQSLKGEDVARVLTAITEVRGLPCTIKSDNGSEFISKVMDKWAYEREVELDFS